MDGHYLSVLEDESFRLASYMDKFIMERIRSMIRSLFPSFPLEPKSLEPLTILIQNSGGEHLVSKLYHSCSAIIPCSDSAIIQKWETDIGRPITEEQWKWCCSVTLDISLNSRHKLLHFKFIRRIYSTPAKQHQIDPSRPHHCPKCFGPQVDFAHLAWTCPALQTEIHATLADILQMPLTPIPEVAVLGYVANYPKPVRKFTAMPFLLAKREVARKWGGKLKPRVRDWLASMVHCNTSSDVYAELLPLSSRPKDIWGPLRSYLLTVNKPVTTQTERGLDPAGIG